jgi:hypothetical protein
MLNPAQEGEMCRGTDPLLLSSSFINALYQLNDQFWHTYLYSYQITPLDEMIAELLDELADLLAEHAPRGTYFGENRHDRGVWGFWPVPENFWEVH